MPTLTPSALQMPMNEELYLCALCGFFVSFVVKNSYLRPSHKSASSACCNSQFNFSINTLKFNIISLFSLLNSKCSKSFDLCSKSTFSAVSISLIFSSVRL